MVYADYYWTKYILSILSIRFIEVRGLVDMALITALFQFYRLDSSRNTLLQGMPKQLLDYSTAFQFYRLDSRSSTGFWTPWGYPRLSILSIRFQGTGRLVELVAVSTTRLSILSIRFSHNAFSTSTSSHISLSILSIRFIGGFGASGIRRGGGRLSILSIRFRTLDPPSLSFRFRFRIELT